MFGQEYKLTLHKICEDTSFHWQPVPPDTGNKLNVHKAFRRRPGSWTSYLRSIYACVPVIPPVFSQILRSETIFCWPKINYITARKSFLWIWSHLLKKSLMENSLSSAVFSRHDNSKATSNFWIKFSEITWFSKRSIRWCIFFFPGNVPLKYFCASAMERYFRKWK